MKTTEPPVVVSQSFSHSRETVWKTITQPELMRQWFFDNIPDFKTEVGFETQFLISNEGRNFTHQWKITEVIPQQKIVYSWSYPEYLGHAYVHFELTGHGQETVLTVTNIVTEDFPDHIPEFKWESCQGGWTYFIKEQLPNFLN